MSKTLLMPKATAIWLVENTALTFNQIAKFCQLHALEVKGIADGDVAQGIRGQDPMTSGQLTREEIERGQADTDYDLQLTVSKVEIPEVKTRRGPKYTPLSRRQDRPNAIQWLLRFHPELKDSQVIKLVGTTKPTINAIRDRTHWNSVNLQPQDPVTLGLCLQMELDEAVQRAADRVAKENKKAEKEGRVPETLLPAAQTIEPIVVDLPPPMPEKAPDAATTFANLGGKSVTPADADEPAVDAESVFAKLQELKSDDSESDGENKEEAKSEEAEK